MFFFHLWPILCNWFPFYYTSLPFTCIHSFHRDKNNSTERSLLCSAVICFWADWLCSSHMQLWVTVTLHSTLLNIHWSVYLQRSLVVTWLVPHETAAIHLSPHSVYTIQPCTSVTLFKAICGVHACLAVTCHCTFGRMNKIFYMLAR